MCMEYGRYAHLTRGSLVSSLSTSYVRYLGDSETTDEQAERGTTQLPVRQA